MNTKRINCYTKAIKRNCDNACEGIDEGDESLVKILVIRIAELAIAIEKEIKKEKNV